MSFSLPSLALFNLLPSPLTGIPFQNGKVAGLWYVGNTVYTVRVGGGVWGNTVWRVCKVVHLCISLCTCSVW